MDASWHLDLLRQFLRDVSTDTSHSLVQFKVLCNLAYRLHRNCAFRHFDNSDHSILSHDILQFGLGASLHLSLLRQFPRDVLTGMPHNFAQFIAICISAFCTPRICASWHFGNSDHGTLSHDIVQPGMDTFRHPCLLRQLQRDVPAGMSHNFAQPIS